jgi:hypothetical protein
VSQADESASGIPAERIDFSHAQRRKPRRSLTPLYDWIIRLQHLSGINRSVALVVSARVSTILGNIGTAVLMLRYLSPVEQGYYFTLISLAAMQVVFELGFSFVVLQLAAHERAHLRIDANGAVEGDAATRCRLASILQLAMRWYMRGGAVLGLCLLPLGGYFFWRGQRPDDHVRWMLPWCVSVAACVWLFVESPLFAFIEGCGQVDEVAGMRLCQTIANTAFAWICMAAGRGLFAPGMVMGASASVGAVFLFRRRAFLLALWRYPVGSGGICWSTEVWPFQWRIAVSWLCGYFALQALTPILFHYRGAAEAGRLGMSISVVGYLSALVLAWMATKAPPFGQLVARGELVQLDALFFRTLRQASCSLGLLAATAMLAVVLLGRWLPALASRLVAPRPFFLLLVGAAGGALVQCMAIYLRSFKREPLLWQSATVAALTLVCARATVKPLGTAGISLSYCFCTGIVGLASALWIFRGWRRTLARGPAPAGGGR